MLARPRSVQDLRLGVHYGVQAGLFKDHDALDVLANAEKAFANAEEPDTRALTIALNEVAALIRPLTLADLQRGRDPFLQKNQKKGTLSFNSF